MSEVCCCTFSKKVYPTHKINSHYSVHVWRGPSPGWPQSNELACKYTSTTTTLNGNNVGLVVLTASGGLKSPPPVAVLASSNIDSRDSL